MVLRVRIFFKSLNAVLVLQHHVEPDDHELFEFRVCNPWIAEVLSDKFAKLLLESGGLEATLIQLTQLFFLSLMQVCSGSEEDTENFEWDPGELLWKHYDKTFFSFGYLGGWVVEVVNDGH